MIKIKGPTAIGQMLKACQIVAHALDAVEEIAVPGVTTLQIDSMVEQFIRDNGGEPAFKGYEGFPNAISASLNTGVVHGIPNDMYLAEGDVLKVDIGVKLDGYFGDSARTYAIGAVEPEHAALIQCAREAVFRGIEQMRIGNRIGDISQAIQNYVEDMGFCIVREYAGHGIGVDLHEEPQVPNFGRRGHGAELIEGMVLAIEPIICEFSPFVHTSIDNWTVLTRDGGYAAHFEHTVAIDGLGPNILTVTGA